jgi:hypothetical protein
MAYVAKRWPDGSHDKASPEGEEGEASCFVERTQPGNRIASSLNVTFCRRSALSGQTPKLLAASDELALSPQKSAAIRKQLLAANRRLKHHAHRALHRALAGAVQKFLARLKGGDDGKSATNDLGRYI